VPPKPSLELAEIEGHSRTRVVLYGRAVPRAEQPPEWGVEGRAEDAFFHGVADGRTEPLGLGYPDLVVRGEWKQLHLLTGDARVVVTPAATLSTPQALCDFFEELCARQKVLEVTWSGGAHRVCRWASFKWQPGRGPDRRWTMTFKVLGRGIRKPATKSPTPTAKSTNATLRKGARSLDDALGDLPPGLEPSFVDRVREAFGKARQACADLRKQLHDVGDYARAPADVLRELTMTAQSARNTLKEAASVYEDVAYEYQVAVRDAKTMLQARAWKTRVLDASDESMEGVLMLLDALTPQLGAVQRFAAVMPGDSLVKLANREYGSGMGELWRTIADANGLVSQLVPAGVTRVLIPEV
jgi:hypothetical protein